MSDKESHLLRRNLARGDTQVSLVLPTLVVHHDDELSLAERFQSFFDRVEGKVGSGS